MDLGLGVENNAELSGAADMVDRRVMWNIETFWGELHFNNLFYMTLFKIIHNGFLYASSRDKKATKS